MNQLQKNKYSLKAAPFLVVATVLALSLFWWQRQAAVGLTETQPASAADKGGMEGMEGMSGMAGMNMGGNETGQATAMLTPQKKERIGLKVAAVEEKDLTVTLRAVGRVSYDERKLAQIHLRVEGWIEDLFVNFTGQAVQKGDPLFTVYAPDFLSTQQEYLLAKKSQAKLQSSPVAEVRRTGDLLAASAKKRLRLWNITEDQIKNLEGRGQAETLMTVYAPTDGVIIKRIGTKGMRIAPDMALYEIADLSSVWVFAEVYESELAYLSLGQDAELRFPAFPGEGFSAKVTFIDPLLNPETRTVRVRLELPNPGLRLKPEMFAEVAFNAPIGRALVIPESAVLDSGLRRIVFVDGGKGMYEPRNVEVSRNGDHYIVIAGLSAGEQVVTAAAFLVDSESKLMASANMMGALGMGGIKMEQAQMGEMDMGGMKDMKGMKGMEGMKPAAAQNKNVEGMSWTLSTKPGPAQEGDNLLRLKIADPSGGTVENATVVFSYTMDMPGMRATKEAAVFKDGFYEGSAQFAMAGIWEVRAQVVLPGKPEVSGKFDLEVGGAMDMDSMDNMKGMEDMPGM